jgi:deazaflavin-dependent oxidoreductase (nitroreductase family)
MKAAPAPGSRRPGLQWFKAKPSGILRLAFRLPIYLYRLNLGWLLGHRGLLLIHRGRRSGLLRETVLEVVRYTPATKESVVLSAWGERADWYRNIKVSPALEVWTGGERYVPKQRFLAPEPCRHRRLRATPPASLPDLRQSVWLPSGRGGGCAPRVRLFIATGGLPSQGRGGQTLTTRQVSGHTAEQGGR